MIHQNSLEAYQNVKPKIETDQKLIISVMEEKTGLTYHQIALRVYKKLLLSRDLRVKNKAFSWRNSNKASRRMKELVEQSKIKVLETTICPLAKSRCNSYVKI